MIMLTKCKTDAIMAVSRKDVLENAEYFVFFYLYRRIKFPLEFVVWVELMRTIERKITDYINAD